MLSEERIKIMTKLAAYELREGKDNLKIGSYFKNDYISLHVILTGITTTIAYLTIILMWIGYKIEYFMDNAHKINLSALGREVVFGYVVLLVIFLTIAYFVYSRRYRMAKASLKKYNSQLKYLEKTYVTEGKNK